MRIIRISDGKFIKIDEPLCVAIGNFDGVHLGHQQLINESKRHGLKSAVLTFYPHPSIYLKNIPNYTLLTPMEHKIDIIKGMGLDYLIIIDFDEEMAKMSPFDFIKNMKLMNIKSCVCGYDFTFGFKALGSVRDLALEFELYEVEKYDIDNVRVSSTYTKELLQIGEVQLAKKLLGRNYSIRGEVIYGNQVGRRLGFPTANIAYGQYVLPGNGVYLAKVLLDDKIYVGMLNIGYNPTLNFCEVLRLEVHIIGFNSDIYGHRIEVFFLERIRSEKKFSSSEELLNQLNLDQDYCISKKKEVIEER